MSDKIQLLKALTEAMEREQNAQDRVGHCKEVLRKAEVELAAVQNEVREFKLTLQRDEVFSNTDKDESDTSTPNEQVQSTPVQTTSKIANKSAAFKTPPSHNEPARKSKMTTSRLFAVRSPPPAASTMSIQTALDGSSDMHVKNRIQSAEDVETDKQRPKQLVENSRVRKGMKKQSDHKRKTSLDGVFTLEKEEPKTKKAKLSRPKKRTGKESEMSKQPVKKKLVRPKKQEAVDEEIRKDDDFEIRSLDDPDAPSSHANLSSREYERDRPVPLIDAIDPHNLSKDLYGNSLNKRAVSVRRQGVPDWSCGIINGTLIKGTKKTMAISYPVEFKLEDIVYREDIPVEDLYLIPFRYDTCAKCDKTGGDDEDRAKCSGCDAYIHFDCIQPPLGRQQYLDMQTWFCYLCEAEKMQK